MLAPSRSATDASTLVKELFRVQQKTYTALLASSESARHTWQRSAALLDQRRDNLKLLRVSLPRATHRLHNILKYFGTIQEHLASRSQSPPSKYDALATDRLLTLADSKFQGLSQDFWDDTKDRQALDFTIELAGLYGTDMLRPNLMNTSPSAAGLDADSMGRDIEVEYQYGYRSLMYVY
jgi:hypothetical protein